MHSSLMVFMQDLAGGGAERVALLLANGFAGLGCDVTLVLVRKKGQFVDSISRKINVIELDNPRTAWAPFALSQLILKHKPDVIISHMTHVNVAAVLAGLLCGYAKRIVLVEHNQFDRNLREIRSLSVRMAYKLARFVYPLAGALVSVSKGVEDALERAGVHNADSYVIYNPVYHRGLSDRAAQTPDHPWLNEDRSAPVVVAVASLSRQKDHPTLLRAIAKINQRRYVRAIILGEGPERANLENLSRELGIDDRVSIPGFSNNPYAYMRAADVFALTSQWEGLPTVLVEALGCGATIVSTDCRSGPAEILQSGKVGYLAQVGDDEDVAHQIESALDHPLPREMLIRRAEDFSVERSLDSYSVVFDRIAGGETGIRTGWLKFIQSGGHE